MIVPQHRVLTLHNAATHCTYATRCVHLQLHAAKPRELFGVVRESDGELATPIVCVCVWSAHGCVDAAHAAQALWGVK